jgi:hypothetical protein
MATMALSSQKNNVLFDPVRKKWVDSTPEEIIRQRLIRQMIDQLGYPMLLMAVEKELAQLPHLKLTPPHEIARRRADIVVFAKGSFLPLLMIECKATLLTPAFAQQVIGYNTFVKAPFIALANDEQVLTGSYDPEAGMYRFQECLPTFADLMNRIPVT